MIKKVQKKYFAEKINACVKAANKELKEVVNAEDDESLDKALDRLIWALSDAKNFAEFVKKQNKGGVANG